MDFKVITDEDLKKFVDHCHLSRLDGILCKASTAADILNVSAAMINRYVKQDYLHPVSTHPYRFSLADVINIQYGRRKGQSLERVENRVSKNKITS
jgi:predicted site-specific integrase-resolvase